MPDRRLTRPAPATAAAGVRAHTVPGVRSRHLANARARHHSPRLRRPLRRRSHHTHQARGPSPATGSRSRSVPHTASRSGRIRAATPVHFRTRNSTLRGGYSTGLSAAPPVRPPQPHLAVDSREPPRRIQIVAASTGRRRPRQHRGDEVWRSCSRALPRSPRLPPERLAARSGTTGRSGRRAAHAYAPARPVPERARYAVATGADGVQLSVEPTGCPRTGSCTCRTVTSGSAQDRSGTPRPAHAPSQSRPSPSAIALAW